ncbi:polysaccharide pyruvyl transferase family protein [Microbacterium sp. NPDC064584]|uniref:polysaccharide pyruvyl transferase family protein n=1 Tax=Microbacterium sp. NPDC064584 TaxID=3155817 RepID=UPI0034139F73
MGESSCHSISGDLCSRPQRKQGDLVLKTDAAYLEQLRLDSISIMGPLLGGAEVALLDAPNQRNVGDSLIWAGEIAYLERMGLRVRYVADIQGYDPSRLRRAMPSGVILLHGGGNFGDLWPGHQTHREQIVRDFPDYRIVQLPQSIYFRDEKKAATANQIIGAHPDFSLLLRDHESIKRARVQLPDVAVTFCYDMALGYAPPAAPVPVNDRRNVLVIARADVERSSGLHDIGADWLPGATITKTDWGPGDGPAEVLWQAARMLTKADHRVVRTQRRRRVLGAGVAHFGAEQAIGLLNRMNVSGAVELYSRAGLVVVDRLHAHVLAALLGLDHIVLDNNYRKIGSVYDEYTGRFSTASYATDIDEARELAMQAVTV